MRRIADHRGVRLWLVPALVWLAGCDGLRHATGDSERTQVQQLRDTVATQARQIEMQRSEIDELSQRLQRMQQMSPEQKLELLPHVVRVQLASLSGGYDDNRDGIDDGIVLYLAPVDSEGDVIKAAGSVQVRLLDLTAPPERQTVGSVSLDAKALRGLWFGKLGSHFSIKVPWAGNAQRPPAKSITALLSFQDYLTGQVFSVQQAFNVLGAAATPHS